MNVIQEDCAAIVRKLNFRPFRNKRVLITGANGLLGQYLVYVLHQANELLSLNCRVTCLSLHGPGLVLGKILPDKLIVFKKTDLSKPLRIPDKFDVIFHAAGYAQPAKFLDDPLAAIKINVNATQALLETARRSRGKFIFFSSAEIYGEIPRGKKPISEDFSGSIQTTNPRAVYGESKRMGEMLSSLYRRDYGVKSIILRMSHVYGPGVSIHDQRALGDFLRGALAEGAVSLKDSGQAVKTYGYVADVIKMIFFIALQGKEDVYHVGGKDSLSIKNLALAVGKQLKVPVRIPRVMSKRRGPDPVFVRLSLSKINKEMGGIPFTPFAAGLKKTIDWNRREFRNEILPKFRLNA